MVSANIWFQNISSNEEIKPKTTLVIFIYMFTFNHIILNVRFLFVLFYVLCSVFSRGGGAEG